MSAVSPDCEMGGAAGRDRRPGGPAEVERRVELPGRTGGEVEIVGQRVRDHLRLLMDLLLHEVPVVALVDEIGGADGLALLPLDAVAVDVEDFDALAAHHSPVAVLEIGDGIGEGRQRNGVGAEIHLALAMADGERRAVARADDQVFLAAEHDGERERALELLQRRMRGLDRRQALLQLARDEMGDDLGVGLRRELVAVGDQRGAQLGEVLDDAVVDDGDVAGEMRMRVGLVGNAVGGPAGVADADRAFERLGGQPALQIDELALGAAAAEPAVVDGGDAGGIVAAIFEPLQRIDDQRRNGRAPDNPDNPAHAQVVPSRWPSR